MVRRLLEYTQKSEPDLPYGLLLVLGMLGTELLRSWSLALTWALNYRTGTRLRGAILTMAFHKILHLRSLREKSVGEVSPGQRPILLYTPIPSVAHLKDSLVTFRCMIGVLLSINLTVNSTLPVSISAMVRNLV